MDTKLFKRICRVFPFKVGDKCCREALRKSGGKVFDKGDHLHLDPFCF